MLITPGSGSTKHIKFLYDSNGKIYGFVTPRPSNFHTHLRRKARLRAIARELMRHVYYLLVMPNTGPILTIKELVDHFYELRELALVYGYLNVRFVMTLYYSTLITPEVIEECMMVERLLGIRIEIKWYPPEPGATTGSGHAGSIPLDASRDEFIAMERNRMPLLVHPESIFDKDGKLLSPYEGEAYFFQNVLEPFCEKRPELFVCGEHVNTKEGVAWVKADLSGHRFITITPHGVLCTMHDLSGPYGALLLCKTRLQTLENRDIVEDFMTSGDIRCGAGDDTAAHLKRDKLGVPMSQVANGAFWTSSDTFPAYAKAFMRKRALDDRFVHFTAFNCLDWRGMPRPEPKDTLRYVLDLGRGLGQPIPVPEEDDVVLPATYSEHGGALKLGLRCEEV